MKVSGLIQQTHGVPFAIKTSVSKTAPRQIVPLPADHVRFSGKLFYKSAEAETIAKALLPKASEAGALTPEAAKLFQKELFVAIMAGKPLPILGEYWYGLLKPDGSFKSADPRLEKLFETLKSAFPPGSIPKEGIPLFLKVRDPQGFEAVRKFLEESLIPACQLKGNVQVRDGNVMPVFETATWPFFKAVIAGEKIPEPFIPLAESLSSLPVFDWVAPTVSPALKTKLDTAFLPVKKRLAAIETARMQYADRINVKEVLGNFVKGAIIGSTGELIIHNTVPEGMVLAGAMRSGLLVGVELVDSIYGQLGAMHSDLQANGLTVSKEDLLGTNSWRDFIKSGFKKRGPGWLFAKRAGQSALKGTTLGTVLISSPIGFVLSNEAASIATRSLVGGFGSIGTSLSIPVSFRATMPQVYLTIRQMIQDGKIIVPQETLKNPKLLHRFARSMAEQELLSRLGFTTSMKAYSLVPLTGGILALEYLGVPRELVQVIFMGVGPAMENLLRLFFTMTQLRFTLPRRMGKVESMVMSTPDREFNEGEKKTLKTKFADLWSRWMGKTVMFVALRKIRLPKVDSVVLVPPEAQKTESVKPETLMTEPGAIPFKSVEASADPVKAAIPG